MKARIGVVLLVLLLLFSFVFLVAVSSAEEILFTSSTTPSSLDASLGEYILTIPSTSLAHLYMADMQREMISQGLAIEYLPIMMAIIEQESGGNAVATGGDIMQASESIDGKTGNIISTIHSINQGIKYFTSLLERAKELDINDIKAVVQSYNYGPGFLDYLGEGGVFTKELAQGFRDKMASQGWAGYGDSNYVANVFRYLSRSSADNGGLFVFPLEGRPFCSYGFGGRTHPLFGTKDFHNGMDFLVAEGTPVLASYYGKAEVVNNESMGLCVITRYENMDLYYMHLSKSFVKDGEEVLPGMTIGLVGNTGYSTEPHLHIQMNIDGTPINLEGYFNPNDYVKGY
ncbi:MAG: peptidoglycan DD-metalloendopeptidase family protein [Tissierellia bacterium]|nr:peptidoglycan DD-metalloendopeptidase family protein [Tissierellia bacterium]